MRFCVLGPVQVEDADGNLLALAGTRQRLLVACLLARAGQVISADRLVDCLWGERRPADPLGALQSQVSRLRQRLGPDAGLETVGNGYRLRPADDDVDAAIFERLMTEARASTDPVAALELLDSALALWRGPAYGDLAAESDVLSAAGQLEELRTSAREQHAELLLALGRPEEAAGEAAMLVDEQPLREPAVMVLIEALHEAGRTGEALAAYERYRVQLTEQLGIGPGAQLRRLHLRILRGEADISRVRATLPRPVTSYVGRGDVVSEVADVVRDRRLATLTGPGGVGKTRLAIEVAAWLAEELPDGVWFCDLAAVADADAVPAAVASTLGIQRRYDRSVTERVVEVLGGRRALLVLDNCEHVLEAAATLVQQIIEYTAKVHVLATSREPLGVPGGRRIVVEPLTDEDGVQLFVDRARAARPGLALSAENDMAAVRRICNEVAGLPLGIELAAARTAARTPVEIASDLAGRVDRLSAPRPGLARHRSVAAVVDWSLDRLSEAEQDLAEHLAVFAGGCTADSAAAVFGRDVADTSDVLVALVDCSIVTPRVTRGRTRYVVLEPVRARAQQRLAQRGLLAAARRAHAAYFAGLTARALAGMRTAEAARWVHTLEREFANLRAACRWSLDTDGGDTALQLLAPLSIYAWSPRLHSEFSEWAEAACGGPAAAGHAALPAVLGLAALGAWRHGDLAYARLLAERAKNSEGSGDTTALAFRASGRIAVFEGRLREAIADYHLARVRARDAGDTFLELFCDAEIALARGYSGDEDAAVAADQVCARAEAGGVPWMVAYASYIAGEAWRKRSPHEALPRLRRAVEIARTAGDEFVVAVAGLSATSIQVRDGDTAAALSDLVELLDEWQREGSWNPIWATLRLCIDAFTRLGDPEPAAQLIGAMHASTTADVMHGARAERLARTEAALRSRLASYDSLVRTGASLGDEGAIALARRTLNVAMRTASSVATHDRRV